VGGERFDEEVDRRAGREIEIALLSRPGHGPSPATTRRVAAAANRKMTYLCVPIFVKDRAQTLRDVAIAAEAGAEMVELRLDRTGDVDLADIIDSAGIPCLATCRPRWEGGYFERNEVHRMAMLERAIPFAAYVDVELKAGHQFIHRAAIAPGGNYSKLIVSSHDFAGRPERLYNIVREMNALPIKAIKIAWTARTIRDNLEAFELLQTKQKPTIALCMGEAGLLSRVLAKKFCAFLTFASSSAGEETAPGQITIHDMKRLYRWDAIGPSTKVYGVVAHPVRHSMSPAIHNAGFDAIGFDGVYLPMLVESSYESFKAFMETFVPFEGLHLSGLSITIPHKENALRYLKEKGAEIEPLAEQIGAVNTIAIDGGKLRGFNTDYAAILDTITQALGTSRDGLKGLRIAVIGAGGTGRTAVAGLTAHGATVVIYNRSKEKADALAAEFNGKTGKVVSARMEKLCDNCCEVLINTTPLGMHPNVDASPLRHDASALRPEMLVFDTIYNPMKTKLLAQAEAVGAKTVGGVEMFVRQAAGQFSAWTGSEAPLGVMRRVIEERLGS
jgi:3-dehydroquinate dehydratase / shikimate dehydrogenase